jgi:glutamate synthase (ferredoxin)
VDQTQAAIPALLAVSGLHHHLIRNGTRTRVGLVLESGEPREVHHYAVLIGYGCGAINPYLVFDTIEGMIARTVCSPMWTPRPAARTTPKPWLKG